MAIVPCDFLQYPRDVMLRKGSTVTPEWPIAFTKLQCSPDEFLSSFPCNHIHGTYGDWERELLHVAELLGIEAKVFRSGDSKI
jgi:L-fucose isomerase